MFSNSGRPGVGQKPRREGQRPLLPQHARHCPVLEAGSSLGFLVYPPLEPNEAAHITYEGEGRYTCGFFVSAAGGTWDKVFSVAFVMPMGSIGAMREEVEFKKSIITDENAVNMAKAFLRAAGSGHAAGRHLTARRHQLPDAGRLGHGLHADLQHDRTARGADADRAGRDRLVRARDRVPLRAAAGRGHEPQPHAADRPGGVRAARGGDAARRHRGGARGVPRLDGPVLQAEGRASADHALRPEGEPALPAAEPGPEGMGDESLQKASRGRTPARCGP